MIKTYRGSTGKRKFEDEVQGYLKVKKGGQPVESITRFYGTYAYQDEYNLILEYADLGTLDDFMQAVDPPQRATDILLIWSRLFELAQALQRVHLAQG